MKANYFKIGIALISVILIALYAGCMCVYGSDFLNWEAYVFQSLVVVGFSLITILLYKYLYQKNKLLFGGIAFALALISFVGISFIGGEAIKYNFEMLIVSIFPLLCYIALKKAHLFNINQNILIVIYNIIVIAFIWILQEFAFKQPYFASDVAAEIYMYIISEIALIVFLIKERKTDSALKTISCLVLVNIVAVLLFLQQERILDIISGFNNSFSATDADGELTNWLSYRLLMLKSNIQRDLSIVNIHYINALKDGCPLAWMSSTYGVHIGLSIFAVETVLVTMMLIGAKKSENAFTWVIALTFLLKVVIALLANLFLIFSTNIGFPIVNSGYDLIMMLLFIINIKFQEPKTNIVYTTEV